MSIIYPATGKHNYLSYQIDDCDLDLLKEGTWFIVQKAAKGRTPNHYVVRTIYVRKKDSKNNKASQKLIYLHREIAKRMKLDGETVDHRDCNSLNNSRANLREATRKQQAHNRATLRTDSACGKTGVYKRKRVSNNKPYVTQIIFNGKHIYLGIYETIEEAYEVRKQAEKNLLGEYAPIRE